MSTVTLKFGGTSVGSVEAIEQVLLIVRRAQEAGQRVVMVVSAMSGVTDMLLQSVREALAQDRWNYLELSRKIREKHEEVIGHLMQPGPPREHILQVLDALSQQHLSLCEALSILGEATPRALDAAVSFGERMSSNLLAAVLTQHGSNARAIDAGDYIVTNDRFQNAEPDWNATESRIREGLLPQLDGSFIPVITGFLGKAPDGHYATLGRGGSDFSAAIFAAFLDSEELIIYTDVDGVMTTDPRVDPRARVLPHISYQEVGELAFYGAKVLHPKTVQPIVNRNIPLRVRNTFNPDHPGTLISAEAATSDHIIKAVTSIRHVSLLTVSGRGMLGVPGVAGRTFLATAQAGASVLMISQSSSEQSICFTVTDAHAKNVKRSVENELRAEISMNDIDGVEMDPEVVIVTVVGAGMRGTPGIAGRVFSVMGEHGVNVLAIAQGSSECSISFVVKEADLQKAVLRLHDLALGA